jgi:hypothetical protein
MLNDFTAYSNFATKDVARPSLWAHLISSSSGVYSEYQSGNAVEQMVTLGWPHQVCHDFTKRESRQGVPAGTRVNGWSSES